MSTQLVFIGFVGLFLVVGVLGDKERDNTIEGNNTQRNCMFATGYIFKYSDLKIINDLYVVIIKPT